MKLFTVDNINAIKQATLAAESITIRTLIDRYGEGAATEIASRWRQNKRVVVFAGPGENGAYALATATRLIERGFTVQIYLFNIGGNSLRQECQQMRNALRTKHPGAEICEIVNTFNAPDITSADLVVDGLFGSELREPLTGGFVSLVRFINESRATVVAIDLPSGLMADQPQRTSARDVINASLTLAVQYPLPAFFIREKAELVGQWKAIEIGLSHEAAEAVKSPFHLVEAHEIKSLLHQRNPFCSKADLGSTLIVAGRFGMVGASILAAKGALRSGSGKVTVFGPQCSFQPVQTAVSEAMFESDDNKLMISDINPAGVYNAIAVGPGIGTSDITANAIEKLLKTTKMPLVIDADALNCIAARPELLNHIPMLSVLTPHEGEFDRLFGAHDNREARIARAIEAAKFYNILILLKGRYTTLVRPDGKIYFNASGSPALATPGSGDVLTGVIASLIAQGYKPEVASIIAAYVHGRAGEICAANIGEFGTTASDIALNVATAINEITKL